MKILSILHIFRIVSLGKSALLVLAFYDPNPSILFMIYDTSSVIDKQILPIIMLRFLELAWSYRRRVFLSHTLKLTKASVIATNRQIPFQWGILEYGGTDSGAIHLSRGRVPSGVLSIPTRYVHSPAEILDKRDVAATVELLVALLENVAEL